MCNTYRHSGSDQAVQLERLAPELKVEKDAYRMCQDLPNQAVLEVPQIAHPNARYPEALTQV